MLRISLISLVVVLFFSTFKFNVFPNTPERNPSADEKYAHIFKPLEGKWKGKFYVYEDLDGQKKKEPQPKDITAETLKGLSLKLLTTLQVEQNYKSISPYLQHVTIKDTYMNEQGEKKVVVSTGVNKVKGNQLICVVNKPDEQVIHRGSLKGENTIVWQRFIKDPLKIEYFKETVEDNTYTIVGWGYYGNDDPQLNPKIWFYGKYLRVK